MMKYFLLMGLFVGVLSADEFSVSEFQRGLKLPPNPLEAIRDLPEVIEVALPQAEISPTVVFERSASGSKLVRKTERKTERWLVSEPWCVNCPPAKARFLASGGDAAHVIPIAVALKLHGRVVGSVPFEYGTESLIETIQPPSYRSAERMEVPLDGSNRPSKSAILKHLRTGGPHQGKHWQAWHLESWKTAQLYALHDDDHSGSVPEFNEPGLVTATVANAEGSAETFAAVLAQHLLLSSGEEIAAPAYYGMFDIDVGVDASWKNFALKILRSESVQFETAGLSVDWSGSKRSFVFEKNAIRIKPGLNVSVQKWRFKFSAGLNAVSFTDDLSSVTMELSGAPDLTINLVSK